MDCAHPYLNMHLVTHRSLGSEAHDQPAPGVCACRGAFGAPAGCSRTSTRSAPRPRLRSRWTLGACTRTQASRSRGALRAAAAAGGHAGPAGLRLLHQLCARQPLQGARPRSRPAGVGRAPSAGRCAQARGALHALAWTPEGRRLLTGAASGAFSLWDGSSFQFETMLQVRALPALRCAGPPRRAGWEGGGGVQAHESAVKAIRFSHNANWIVSADAGGRVKYWKPNLELVKVPGRSWLAWWSGTLADAVVPQPRGGWQGLTLRRGADHPGPQGGRELPGPLLHRPEVRDRLGRRHPQGALWARPAAAPAGARPPIAEGRLSAGLGLCARCQLCDAGGPRRGREGLRLAPQAGLPAAWAVVEPAALLLTTGTCSPARAPRERVQPSLPSLRRCVDVQSLVASGSRDALVKFWDARSGGQALHTLSVHKAAVSSLAWHPNGNWLLSTSRDHTVKVPALSQRGRPAGQQRLSEQLV